MKLFVSYAHSDSAYVNTLVNVLRDDISQHDVWKDDRIVIGREWWEAILEKIENCESF